MASSQATQAQLRSLYRAIIRNVKVFPSIGRGKMLQEVRQEFRINAKETDAVKVDQYQQKAMKGLVQLQAYTGLRNVDANWSVKLEEAPLGAPSEDKIKDKFRRLHDLAEDADDLPPEKRPS